MSTAHAQRAHRKPKSAAIPEAPAAATAPGRQSSLPWLAAVLVLTLIVFGASTRFDFTQWDDPVHVLNNPDVQSMDLKAIFSTTPRYMYHPLTILSYAINYATSEFNPVAYHFTNLLLHLVNAALVFFLFLRLFKSRQVAALAGLLFGIHPLVVEPVCWISGRKDVLFAAFYLGSMVGYLRYLDRKSVGLLFLALVLGLCSMLSKPMAATLPAALLLLDVLVGRKVNARVIGEKLLFVLPVAIVLAIPVLWPAVQSEQSFNFGLHPDYSLGERIILALNAACFYAEQFIVPTTLSGYHPYPKEGSLFSHYIGAGFLTLLAIAAWRIPEQRRAIIVGLVFYGVTISPVSQIIPYGTNVYLADRYAYIPLIGLVLCIAAIFHWALSSRKELALGLGIAAVVGLASVAYSQTETWTDDEALWSHAISLYPDDAWVYWNRGNYYRSGGRNDLALADFSTALQHNPKFTEAWFNRGSLRGELNDNKAALEDLSNAIRYKPKLFTAWYLRGNVKAALGDFQSALGDFTEAIRLKPDYAEAIANRGNTYGALGDVNHSIADYNRALQLNPKDDKTMSNRGLSKYNIRDLPGACADWQAAANLGNAPAKEMIGKYCR